MICWNFMTICQRVVEIESKLIGERLGENWIEQDIHSENGDISRKMLERKGDNQ